MEDRISSIPCRASYLAPEILSTKKQRRNLPTILYKFLFYDLRLEVPTHLVLLGIIDHSLDLLLAEPALVVGDGDLVLLPRGLVASRHVEDPVGINVEGDLNLWYTPGSRGYAGQVKLAQQVVVLGHGPLTLVNLQENSHLKL